MSSPFKFLDAYEKKDRDIFFGRENEIELLYDTTFKTKLMLVYGQSGTGKTSLIQCGLANRFRATDWFEIYIRRRSNINSSLRKEIRKKADTPIEEGSTIVEAIQSLYLDFLRPVYLIFDQFEELITIGSKKEQQEFFNTVSELLKSSVSCKIIIVMREEYIAWLYDFEQVVPELFDNRIRIEPMHTPKVEEVIRGSAEKFEIKLVYADKTVKGIIENNKDKKGEIQLPYLQVYLDRLYRDATERVYTEGKKSVKKAAVKFTLDLVKKIGKMSDVMAVFLDEQITQIQRNLIKNRLDVRDDVVWQVLKEFVTIEGTNLPKNKTELISKLDIPENIVNFCLTGLEKGRILHAPEKDTFEIAHDTLAQRIGDRRSLYEEELLRAEKIIKDRLGEYEVTGNLLNKKDINYIEPYEDELKLVDSENRFLRKSKEKVSRIKKTTFFGIASIITILITFTIFAVSQWQRAEKNFKRAEANRLATIAQMTVEKDPTIALRVAEKALQLNKNEIVTETIHRIYRENRFYKKTVTSNAPIISMALSPDGKYILAGLSDQKARIWDLDGKEIHVFEEHEGSVTSVAFSPDGKYILTGSYDRKIRLWKFPGEEPVTLEGHIGPVKSVIFSPDGRYILSCSWDKTARLWNSQGREVNILKGHKKAVLTSAFSPNSKYILTGSADNTVFLWDLRGKKIRDFIGHEAAVNSVSFSPDGENILTGSRDGTVRLWNLEGKEITVFKRHGGPVTSAAFSPDGHHILTGSEDRTARLWNLSGKELQIFKGHNNRVTSAIFSPDSRFILTSSLDEIIRMWDIRGLVSRILKKQKTSVHSVTISPGNKYALSGLSDGTILLMGLQENGKVILDFSGHDDAVTSCIFSPDGRYILTASEDHTARLWDLAGNEVLSLKKHKDVVSSAAFSPDGKYILTGSYDRTARLWDLRGEELKVFDDHDDIITAVAFSPDGRNVLTASWDKTVRLMDLDGNILKTFSKPTSLFSSAAFSPNGKNILTGSMEGTEAVIRLWDLHGNELRVIKGHENRIVSAVFSPDGKYILTASWDNTARLWDLEGKELQVFKRHSKRVNSAVFSPDGEFVLTGSSDNTTRIWHVRMVLEDFLKEGICERPSKKREQNFGI